MSRLTFILFSLFLLPGCYGAEYGLTDYDVTPIGPKRIYAGHDGLIPIAIAYLPGGQTRYLYFDAVGGVPEGVAVEVFCGMDERCTGTPLRWIYPYPQFTAAVHVTADSSVTPGDYTLTLNTHDYEGHSHTTEIALTILAAPEPVAGPATYQPPIPTLSQWQQVMTSQGATFCNEGNKNQKFAFGYEGSVWYYDGARVFYQIQDATQQDIWRECAENVASQYAEYVNSSCGARGCGAVPAWRVFTRGLRLAYERTGDEKYRTALENLAASGLMVVRPGALSDDYIRETAYVAEAFIEAKLINSPNFDSVYANKLKVTVNELLAMYEQLFDAHTYALHQPFFDGIAAEALIGYYTHITPDPRIPPAIKKMLDWTWNAGWDKKAKQLVYQPDTVPWTGHNGLIGLLVPAFAWYYNVSGDVVYLQRGDELFSHMFDEPFYSGKQFSQAFRWSFDYVAWRKPTSESVGITVPEHLYPSGEQQATITLPKPAAGKCGEAVRFSNVPERAGWPGSVSVDRGASSKTVRIRPNSGGGLQKTTVTASYRSLCGQAAISGMAVTSVGGDHLDVVLTATRVPAGMFQNNRIALDAPAPDSDMEISLTTDRPDLVRFFDADGRPAASIKVPRGAVRSEYFYVDAGHVSASTSVTVNAKAGELEGSATFLIDPPAPRLALQNGHLLAGGFTTTLNQVVLGEPAASGGTTVSVWTDLSAALNGPLTVTVPEGEISSFFNLTPALSAPGGTPMRLAYGSGKSFTYLVEVVSRKLALSGIPASLRGGASATGTLSFDSWIPVTTEVTLESSDSSVVVPGTVTLARGDAVPKAAFSIQAGNVTATKSVTITASSPTGHQASVTITVKP